MKFSVVVIFAVFVVGISARSIVKRNNNYGDEPAPAAGVVSGGSAATPATEEHPAKVHQSVPAAAPQQSSGYRRKRNNSYGDEPAPATPAAASSGAATSAVDAAPAASEEHPAEVHQSVPAVAPQQASGYRRKRNNSYGDEASLPAGKGSVVVPSPEQGPSSVNQSGSVPRVNIHSSGY